MERIVANNQITVKDIKIKNTVIELIIDNINNIDTYNSTTRLRFVHYALLQLQVCIRIDMTKRREEV